MKTRKIFSSIFMAVVMLVSAVAFTSCKQEELDTNQYTGEISLLAYGPSPVARGGQLRFLGTGMDQIASIKLEGCDPISDIERVSAEEIRITVPQNAQPGYPVLVTKGGKEIEAKTRLTFTEPVGFADEDAIAPNPVKPGQKLTIKGSYLNLVQTIVFADKVAVDEFEEHTREQIILVVPAEAKTGKVILSFVATGDSIPNEILSGEVLEVVLPSVDTLTVLDDKKPGDKISITGKDFDLITAVMSPTNDSIEYTATETTLEFDMPANITNGGIFVLTASGVKVPVATVNVALPKEIVATPNADLRPEDVITITGVNLELVTDVTFPTSGDPKTVELEADGTATEIAVKMPAEAISGKLLLNTKANISVEVEFATKKPALGEYNPAPVPAGTNLTITGTDLDLVAKITFPTGGDVTEFVSQSATEIVVKVPVTTLPGALKITMKNGETVDWDALTVQAPAFCYVTEWPKNDVFAGTACPLGVSNGDVLEKVLLNGEEISFMFINGRLYIGIPDEAPKKCTLTLNSGTLGEVDYPFTVKPNSEVTTDLWQGMEVFDGSNQPYLLSDAGLEFIEADVQVGDVLTFYFTVTADDWWWEVGEGHWTKVDGEWVKYAHIDAENDDLSSGTFQLVVTQELLDYALTQGWWGGVFVAQGDGLILTKITTTHFVNLEQELAVGPFVADGWTAQPTVLNNGELNEASAGQILKFYMTPLKEGWCLQLYDAGWGSLDMEFKPENYDLDAHDGAIEVTLTDALIASMKNGVILNGDGCKITSIGLK